MNTMIRIRPMTSPETLRQQSKISLIPKHYNSKIRPKSLSFLIDEAEKGRKEMSRSSLANDKDDFLNSLFKDSDELYTLAKHLCDDLCHSSHDIELSDVVGLDDAKRVLKESVILPTIFPNLFKGLLQPWRGVLIYGLPGTGKSFLARAISQESGSTFFNIPASSVVSKYRGESEKIIRVLFTLARHHSPSIIFFDEADSIMGIRSSFGGEQQEHEGSRRMKTELLVEMDGINTGNHHVFVLAATNLPWEIDAAFLRRLEKRVFIPLPNKNARKCLVKEYLKDLLTTLGNDDVEKIADSLENFTPFDIKMVCKEAIMVKVRYHLDKFHTTTKSQTCMDSSKEVDLKMLLGNDPVTLMNILESIRKVRGTPSSDWIKKYSDWESLYGFI